MAPPCIDERITCRCLPRCKGVQHWEAPHSHWRGTSRRTMRSSSLMSGSCNSVCKAKNGCGRGVPALARKHMHKTPQRRNGRPLACSHRSVCGQLQARHGIWPSIQVAHVFRSNAHARLKRGNKSSCMRIHSESVSVELVRCSMHSIYRCDGVHVDLSTLLREMRQHMRHMRRTPLKRMWAARVAASPSRGY